MQIKLGQLPMIHSSLSKLVQLSVPAKIYYRLSKNVRLVEQELKQLEEQRQKLAAKYEVPSLMPGQEPPEVQPSQEVIQAFNQEWIDLLNSEIELGLMQFTAEDLGDAVITPTDLFALEGNIMPDTMEGEKVPVLPLVKTDAPAANDAPAATQTTEGAA